MLPEYKAISCGIFEVVGLGEGEMDAIAGITARYSFGCDVHVETGEPDEAEDTKGSPTADCGGFPDIHAAVEDVGAEDRVMVCDACRVIRRVELDGIPPAGPKVSLSGITMLWFEGGKRVERWSRAGFLSLLQQPGAIPAPESAGA